MSLSLQELVTIITQMGLDTQPLYDYQKATQAGVVDEAQYLHTFKTLNTQVTKYKAGQENTMAVKFLIDRIKDKLSEDLGSMSSTTHVKTEFTGASLSDIERLIDSKLKAPSTPSAHKVEDQSSELMTQILDEIRHIKTNVSDEIKSLKGTVGHQNNTISSSKPDTPSYEDDGVFVNPIDEEKVKSLKSNVNIDTKVKDSNLKEKIRRLKKLKSEG